MGCYEISLGDTIGAGTPGKTQRMIEAVAAACPVEKLGGHFHDTYGQALANILASLELGVAIFDSSVAGLGRLPLFAGRHRQCRHRRRAVHARRPGHRNRRDMDRLLEAAEYICGVLGRPTHSRAGRAIAAKRRREAAAAAA